ncbi:MAG: hybrid sensor histidine kinase/response regulator, partial [Chloroflexi bacterium]|nr:hybrid sensor histidine kinase/response regulator [Chloroflexota bacterium]
MIASQSPVRALLIEDNPGDVRLIREMLRDGAVELVTATRLADGLREVTDHPPDLVLLDLSLPDSHGFETFDRVHATVPEIAVVVLSGLNDEELAVRAVHEGAQDYLVKGQVDGAALFRSMRYAIERQRLESARRDLERQRDEFFSSVSHDLRTPVAAIKAAIGVVLANEPPNLSPALRRLLGNIDQSADDLTVLIDDLLEVARLQAGRVELWRSEVDMREVLQRVARSLEPLVHAREQHLRLELPEVLVMASVDAECIGRVLRNLIGNAQKYGREGGDIVVRLDAIDDEVCMSVADDGPGIPPDQQERIFERFHRLGTGGTTLGSGLGL